MANNRKRGGGFFSGPSGKGGGSLLTGSKSIFLAFIVLVIGGGFLLTGGNPLPQEQLTEPDDGDVVYEIDEESLEQEDGRQNLQLRTIEFKECGQTTAATLQLDITGSMSPAIDELRNAVYAFTDSLSDESIIGIQAYNTNNPRREVIPVSYYRDVKNQIKPAVDALNTGGSTPSYDALIYSGEILSQAINQYPERQFYYIFFSDGNPNRGPDTSADMAEASGIIKDMGVTVYAIGLAGNTGIDENIIETIASSPETAITTTDAGELERIYGEIAQRICEDAEANS